MLRANATRDSASSTAAALTRAPLERDFTRQAGLCKRQRRVHVAAGDRYDPCLRAGDVELARRLGEHLRDGRRSRIALGDHRRESSAARRAGKRGVIKCRTRWSPGLYTKKKE